MTTSKKSSKTSIDVPKSAVTRSFSLTPELDQELNAFMERLKRSRSSIISEALQNFFLNNAPKDK